MVMVAKASKHAYLSNAHNRVLVLLVCSNTSVQFLKWLVLYEFLIQVKLFPGRKLEYEPKHCAKHRNERDRDFMTVVEFSAEDPYGRAVALLDFKSGLFKVHFHNSVKFVNRSNNGCIS